MFAVNAAPFNNESNINTENMHVNTRGKTIRKREHSRETFSSMNVPTKTMDYSSELIDNNKSSQISEQYKLPVQQKNIESLIQRLHNSSDDSNDNLSDFNPPPKPSSVGSQRREDKDNSKNNTEIMNNESDEPVTVEGFNTILKKENDNNSLNQYYKQFSPSYFSNNYSNNDNIDNINNNINTKNELINNKQLIEKLNYMINLLEEQKDEKTGHVTEEIILYSFLGIFIIFVIDSFARASKYVR